MLEMRSGCRFTAATCFTTSNRRLASSSLSISSSNLNFSRILRALAEKPAMKWLRLAASLSGSPLSFWKVNSLVLWKFRSNFRLIIFSMVSSLYLPTFSSCL